MCRWPSYLVVDADYEAPVAYRVTRASRGEAPEFRCPARHYRIACRGQGRCEVRGAVRVPLATDRRLFTPLARPSYAWQRL